MHGRTEQVSSHVSVSHIPTTKSSIGGLSTNAGISPNHSSDTAEDRPGAHECTPFHLQVDEVRQKLYVEIDSMILSDFVRSRFIPEYVETRRPATRAHFLAILKHLISPAELTPELTNVGRGKVIKDRILLFWPYLGSLPLREIDENRIRNLTGFVLESGYSIQTATHVRNVTRAIFSHAIDAYCYTGLNPAAQVELPAMARKDTPSLTLQQVKQLVPAMRYPERAIALLALLTDMNVAEICGLQWQYVNLSTSSTLVEGEWIPPKTIAVRNQFYRGEFAAVTAGRRRLVSMPETISSMLRDMKTRRRFTNPDNFVVPSRTGTPVHPENIAARRLKAIGKAHDIPWLSWSAFRRTNRRLRAELELHLQRNTSSPVR